jgi:N-acetylglucosamine-6-phosphate deacetylase
MLLAGRLVRAGRAAPGWVEVSGERVAGAGWGSPPRRPDERHDGLIARGLVDLQVNGGAGDEVTGGPAALDRIDAWLLARGVTSWLPTVVSTDDATAARAATEIAQRAADPASGVEGAHLEGPFLSAAHPGAHRPEHLRDRVQTGALPAAYASSAVRLVTLAPELPGALDLVAQLRRRGVTVALGHSGCDAATATLALDAGARLVTHVFNAMAPLHHRAPGLAGVALTDRRASVSVIADGRHVDPLVLRVVRRAAGRRVVLVSDASAAALAGTPLRADATTAQGVLAGTTLTLDEAARRWSALAGATVPEALAAASSRPARLLGLEAFADLVLLSDDAAVQRVMRRGRWVR